MTLHREEKRMIRQRWTIGGVVVVVLAGCGGTPQSPPKTPQPPPQAAAAPQAAVMPDSIRWVRDAAEFRAAFVQAYRAATRHVEEAAAGRTTGSWAVVLDADETVISNRVYQEERARAGLPFTADSWRAWVARREATPLPGAADFLRRARALGAHIAIVTNRLATECEDTRAVFDAHQLPYDAMLCRPDGTPGDKNPRFEAVAQGRTTTAGKPLEVLAYIGDNILDFPKLSQAVAKGDESALAQFGRSYFILPNPMYGSWQ